MDKELKRWKLQSALFVFLSHFHVCEMHACMHLCMCVGTHTCVYPCTQVCRQARPEVHAWNPLLFHLIQWSSVSQSNPDWLIRLVSLASLLRRPLSLSSEAGIAGELPCPPSIYMGSGDSNSHPHTCVASMLTTEPCLQPLSFCFLFLISMVVSHLGDLVGLKVIM